MDHPLANCFHFLIFQLTIAGQFIGCKGKSDSILYNFEKILTHIVKMSITAHECKFILLDMPRIFSYGVWLNKPSILIGMNFKMTENCSKFEPFLNQYCKTTVNQLDFLLHLLSVY